MISDFGKIVSVVLGGYVTVSLFTIEAVVPGFVLLLTFLGFLHYDFVAYYSIKFYVAHIAMVRRSVWEIFPADFDGSKLV